MTNRSRLRPHGLRAQGMLVAGILALAMLVLSVSAAAALESNWSSGGNVGPGIRVYTPAGYQAWRQSQSSIPQVSSNVDAVCSKGVETDGTIRNGTNPCTYSNPGAGTYAVFCWNTYPSGPNHRAYSYWTGTLSRPISGWATTTPF